MTSWLQFTFAGISIGCVYALLAVGWVVNYQVARVLNFAQGGYLVFGAFMFAALSASWPWPAAMLVSVIMGLPLGIGMHALLLNGRTTRNPHGPIVLGIGIALLMGEMARHVWGNQARTARRFLSTEPIDLLGATVSPHALLLWAGTALALLAAWLLFTKTFVGRALVACSEDVTGAELVGIRPALMRRTAFALSGVLGTAAGVLLVPLLAVSWSSIFLFSAAGLAGAAIGRWQYAGAAVGSLGLGLAESYTAGYFDARWQRTVVFGVLIIVLLLSDDRARSRGRLFGRKFPPRTRWMKQQRLEIGYETVGELKLDETASGRRRDDHAADRDRSGVR